MISWFKDLMKKTSCDHSWVEREQINKLGGNPSGVPISKIYVLRCSKCGNMKHYEVRA